MTPTEINKLKLHAKYIRELQFELHKADYGMGMPRDYAMVQHLKKLLAEAGAAPCPVCGRTEPEGDCCIEAGRS